MPPASRISEEISTPLDGGALPSSLRSSLATNSLPRGAPSSPEKGTWIKNIPSKRGNQSASNELPQERCEKCGRHDVSSHFYNINIYHDNTKKMTVGVLNNACGSKTESGNNCCEINASPAKIVSSTKNNHSGKINKYVISDHVQITVHNPPPAVSLSSPVVTQRGDIRLPLNPILLEEDDFKTNELEHPNNNLTPAKSLAMTLDNLKNGINANSATSTHSYHTPFSPSPTSFYTAKNHAGSSVIRSTQIDMHKIVQHDGDRTAVINSDKKIKRGNKRKLRVFGITINKQLASILLVILIMCFILLFLKKQWPTLGR